MLTGDGNLQQVNINTGDAAPPVKFLPPNGKPYSLALVDNIIYTITGQGCGGNPNSVYSLDLNDPAKTVRYWRSGSGGLWGTAGPAIGADGTVYAETGDGQTDPAANRYANAVIALTPKELKLKDWYAPTNAEWLYKRDLDMNVTPVVFPYKGRELAGRLWQRGAFLPARLAVARRHRSPDAALPIRFDLERGHRLRRRRHVGQPVVVGRRAGHALGARAGLGAKASERDLRDEQR